MESVESSQPVNQDEEQQQRLLYLLRRVSEDLQVGVRPYLGKDLIKEMSRLIMVIEGVSPPTS